MKYNRIPIILLIFTVLFCISALGTVSAEDIGNNTTTTNNTINNTGQSNYTGPQTNTVNWTSSNGGNLDKLVAVGSDGTIYVGTLNGEDKDGYLYVLYSNGTRKWGYHTGGVSGLTLGSDGTIYVKEYFGTEYAFNPDGTLKWNTTETTVNTGFSTIGSDGTIYLVSNGYLYAYNSDGTLKWQFSTETLYGVRLYHVCGSPVIGSDGTLYIAGTYQKVYQSNGQTLIEGTQFNLYAINPDGTLKWTYTTGSAAGSNIKNVSLGSDGTIYIINWGTISALNPDGTLKWTYTSDGQVNSISISKDGTIYFGTYGSGWALYALNPEGKLKWKYTTNCSIYGCTIGADGTIYFGTYGVNNGIYALNPDGKLKWTYNLGNWCGILGTPLINSDGTLCVLSCDGVLYAFKDLPDTTKPTVTATPAGGTYYIPQNVTLKTTDENTTKTYYTTDGTDPTISSTRKEYTGMILINTSKTLKFAALDSANNWSLVYTAKYTIYKKVAYTYTVKVPYKKGWYKYKYKVSYKKWYKYKGKWKYKWIIKWKYKWKYGWLYKTVVKTGTKNVLT